MPIFSDPLKISYLVIIGDDAVEDSSPFQGFGPSWNDITWALRALAQLPADVLEPSHSVESITAQRIGGIRQLRWIPLSVSPFLSSKADELGFFVVLFTNDVEVSHKVASWITSQKRPVLHISFDGYGSPAQKFGFATLHDYCKKVVERHGTELSKQRESAVRKALAAWKQPKYKSCDLKAWSHNITIPNQMVLARAGYRGRDPEPYQGFSERDYSDVMLESVNAVNSIRQKIGYRNFHRLSLIHPKLYLVEPALYRHSYSRIKLTSNLDATAMAMLRAMQTQRGLHLQISGALAQSLLGSNLAQQLIALRKNDLEIFTVAVGLRASQTCTPVMRLSPGVNHVFQLLGNYARNVRSKDVGARLKTPRLFKTLQEQLRSALGEQRLETIAKCGGPIKIVSDAPIEWVPISGLPLMLRYDCSRLCSTPGNLLLGLLAKTEPVTVTPNNLRNILVISSFKEDDPLRDLLVNALDITSERWVGKVKISFQRISSENDLISALNASDAPIMIFDGHGSGNSSTGIATLKIGDRDVDVWQLRGRARIPPIVILSACDTHGVDASSHATVGNGFLAAGAQTVLATLLPVGGISAASFVARLVYRLADFIPAALEAKERVLNWTEIISGMQRMLLVSEILDAFFGPIEGKNSIRAKLQSQANLNINIGELQWFELLLEAIAECLKESSSVVGTRAAALIARSEAIRYIQLGNPENILIDDGSIADLFLYKNVERSATKIR